MNSGWLGFLRRRTTVQRRSVRLIAIAVVLPIFLLVLAVVGLSYLTRPAAPAGETTEAASLPAPPTPVESEEAPIQVYVGVYAFQVPDLSLIDNSYLVDFWIWFRWQGLDYDPSETFELLNLFEGWDVLSEPLYVDDEGNAAPDPLGDDWYYQVYRIQSRFGMNFDVSDYPFDRQELVIAIEDGDMVAEEMMYIPDFGTASIDPNFRIPGWIIQDVTAEVVIHEYPTNWGDPRSPGNDRYARFRYSIHIDRPVLGYLATTLVPIVIVMLITLMVFLINSKYFEGRLGLVVTTLIAAVALQLTASGDLPRTGYLVLLDHIYNLSYAMIFFALLESIVAVRLHDRGQEALAKRVDWWGFWLAITLYFASMLWLVLGAAF
jgi:hypothetical protein